LHRKFPPINPSDYTHLTNFIQLGLLEEANDIGNKRIKVVNNFNTELTKKESRQFIGAFKVSKLLKIVLHRAPIPQEFLDIFNDHIKTFLSYSREIKSHRDLKEVFTLVGKPSIKKKNYNFFSYRTGG